MGENEDKQKSKKKSNDIDKIKNDFESEKQKLLDDVSKRAKKKKKLMSDDVESDYDSFFR